MSSSTIAATAGIAFDSALAARILREGYGPGAWHGPDLRAAIADVDAATAFRRPAKDRHNIAEIAAHHAFTTRSVIERLGGAPAAFPLAGEDWFALDDERTIAWTAITRLVDDLHNELAMLVTTRPDNGMTAERCDLVLGITCHAVYHAGQIQLIKRLLAEQ